MVGRPRRAARLVLAAVAVLAVGLGVFAWEPVHWWVMTVRRYHETVKPAGRAASALGWSQRHRGWYHVARWGRNAGRRYGPFVYYYPQTGTKYKQGFFFRDGSARYTVWWIDGSTAKQRDGEDAQRSPPWRWNIADQTAPSMPRWMGDDQQWQHALDAQRK